MKDYGLRLNPPREEDLARLEELRRTLSAAWDERRIKLTQAHQLQQFKEQADQADSWLASKEAFLNNDDLGVSCFIYDSFNIYNKIVLFGCFCVDNCVYIVFIYYYVSKHYILSYVLYNLRTLSKNKITFTLYFYCVNLTGFTLRS